MKSTRTHFARHLCCLLGLCLCLCSTSHAQTIIWSCSRAEPEQKVFEGIKAFRIENLSSKEDSTISITLMDLYAAYGGQSIQMGRAHLSVCVLPPQDALQAQALALLGYSTQDLSQAAQQKASGFVFIPSIHDMQKCLNEHHPAIGFFQNVVENERVAPCF